MGKTSKKIIRDKCHQVVCEYNLGVLILFSFVVYSYIMRENSLFYNIKYVHVYGKMLLLVILAEERNVHMHLICRRKGKITMQDIYKYSYTVENKLMNSLSVYSVGHQRCFPGHQWGPGIRDHYLIHHVINGKGYYETRGKIYSLKKGDTFLVYPNTQVRYWADEKDPWEYAWVGFAGSDAISLMANTEFTEGAPVLAQAEISENIEAQLLEIYATKGNQFCDAVSMTGALYTLMSILIKNSNQERKEKNHQSVYLERALQYIAERYSYPITVEDVAAYTGVSRSYLFRIFQKLMNKSPKDYLADYRLRQSCQLLAESKLSITAVAHSVGFEDNLYFSKAFKKYTGKTPSQYREQRREMEHS